MTVTVETLEAVMEMTDLSPNQLPEWLKSTDEQGNKAVETEDDQEVYPDGCGLYALRGDL